MTTKTSKRAFVIHVGMRTVKWWVRYRPGSRTLVYCPYRTKKAAIAAQRVGEVVLQVKGHYFPGEIMQPRRRAQPQEPKHE